MTVLQHSAPEITADTPLLVWLASEGRRQHFLVRRPVGLFGTVGYQLMSFGAPPVRLCTLPGPLRLPADRSGTLVLDDVAALRVDQQIALFDWLGGGGDVRVIAVTAAPLRSLVENGAFLESLFHRLGAVQLDLTAAERAVA
jgi:Sigma-54 interaction domain